MEPISCNCEVCRNMCRNSTCLPTPAEARTLIKAGYASRLAGYSWHNFRGIGPAPKGYELYNKLPNTRLNSCTFFTESCGCELHDQGLKPLEGRLAHHSRDWQQIRSHVMSFWKGKAFESVEKLLEKNT